MQQYREALQRAQQQIMAASGYPAEVEGAVASYQQRGGRFEDQEDRQRLEDARSFVALYAQLDQQLRAALASQPPNTEDLQRGVRSRTSTDRNTAPGVRIRAIFSDIRAGETFWVDDIRAAGGTDAEALLDPEPGADAADWVRGLLVAAAPSPGQAAG